MPEIKQNGTNGSSADPLCKRCSEQKASCVVRQDKLCHDCFVKFAKTKVIKRMEAFRGLYSDQNKIKKFLVPVSLGVSSTTLLHILDDHSQGQITRSGQARYELHCLHVLESEDSTDELALIERMINRYPRHAFFTKPIMSTSELTASCSPLPVSDTESTADQSVDVDKLQKFNIQTSMSSASSRADLLQIARGKTIVEAAREQGCDGILWGDTTTRLSEKVLAETAKGRGFSVPWLVNDGPNSNGMLFLYPMKDILKKEVLLFADILHLSKDILPEESIVASKPTLLKNSTIDSLMTDYFRSVEENYPSIVANVVRTSSKLQGSGSDVPTDTCALCDMPSHELESIDGRGSHLGEDSTNGSNYGPGQKLCYGCSRLMRGENG